MSRINVDTGDDGESLPGTPLWVKTFGIIVALLILLVLTLHLTGHGPMNHMGHTSHTP